MGPVLAILHTFEIGACVTGFVYYKKLRFSVYKWFPVYLAFIVLSELLGEILRVPSLAKFNSAYFNDLVIPVEFLFFFWLFFQSFKKSKYKTLPVICSVIYLGAWITDLVYFSRFLSYFYFFSYTFGNLLLLVLILVFFIQLVNSDAILSFRKNILFWVSLGLLIFYLGSFPYYGLRNLIVYKYPVFNTIYGHVVVVLNCIMYLMFTLSFIWGKPNTSSL